MQCVGHGVLPTEGVEGDGVRGVCESACLVHHGWGRRRAVEEEDMGGGSDPGHKGIGVVVGAQDDGGRPPGGHEGDGAIAG